MFSLALRRLTGADDPDAFVSVGMGSDQNPTGAQHSDGDKLPESVPSETQPPPESASFRPSPLASPPR